MRRAAVATAKTFAALAAMVGYMYAESKWLDLSYRHPVLAAVPFLIGAFVGIFCVFYFTTKTSEEPKP